MFAKSFFLAPVHVEIIGNAVTLTWLQLAATLFVLLSTSMK